MKTGDIISRASNDIDQIRMAAWGPAFCTRFTR